MDDKLPGSKKTRAGLRIAAALAGILALDVGTACAQQDDTDAARTPPAAAEAPARKPRVRTHVKRVEPAVGTAAAEPEAPSPVKHVCLIDHTAVEQHALVNVASNKRLAELRAAAQNDIDANRKRLEPQIRGVDQDLAQKPKDATLLQKRQDLAEEAKHLLARTSLYSREVEATRQLVTAQLQTATKPLLQDVFKSNGCSLLITRAVVVETGDAVDITQPTIDLMNKKLTFQPFALVDLSSKTN